MTKETLTIGAIRRELKIENKRLCTGLWVVSVLLLVFALLTVWMVKLSGLFIVMAFFFGAWSLLFLLLLVNLITDIVKLKNILKRRICVVKDTLIGMEEEDDIGRRYIRKIYHLHFSGYGEYITVDHLEHYAWSTVLGPMSGEGIYRTSHCGDEFYLVLSEPNTGKILGAYNTNLFDLGGE